MARKEKTVTISSQGRDYGKIFYIKEMPTYKTEKWAARALLALAKVSGDTPDAIDGVGGLSDISIASLAKLDWESAEPLLDEMMSCVQICPNPGDLSIRRPLSAEADDIEEVSTMLTLRKEILGLHFDFFGRAGASTSATNPQSPATS